MHALSGRYTQRLTLADLSPSSTPSGTPSNSSSDAPHAAPSPSPRDVASAQRLLDSEQARVRALMRDTVAHATHWLVLVCGHLGVDMAQLPEDPGVETRLVEALDVPGEGGREGGSDEERRKEREKREWDCVWELVLVSLGLVGAGQQAAEPDKDKKASRVGAAGAVVGGLFGSSKSAAAAPATTEKDDPTKQNQPPPLDYTALSRTLVVSTADVLGISSQVVSDVERAIAQFLYFQYQQQSDAEQRSRVEGKDRGAAREGEGKGWDEAAREYRDRAAKKGSALKWAATGAGIVLGGVAIGLTGGASWWSRCTPLAPPCADLQSVPAHRPRGTRHRSRARHVRHHGLLRRRWRRPHRHAPRSRRRCGVCSPHFPVEPLLTRRNAPQAASLATGRIVA